MATFLDQVGELLKGKELLSFGLPPLVLVRLGKMWPISLFLTF